MLTLLVGPPAAALLGVVLVLTVVRRPSVLAAIACMITAILAVIITFIFSTFAHKLTSGPGIDFIGSFRAVFHPDP